MSVPHEYFKDKLWCFNLSYGFLIDVRKLVLDNLLEDEITMHDWLVFAVEFNVFRLFRNHNLQKPFSWNNSWLLAEKEKQFQRRIAKFLNDIVEWRS